MDLIGINIASIALVVIILAYYWEITGYRINLKQTIHLARQPEVRQSLSAETMSANLKYCEKELSELFFWVPFTWIALSSVALLWFNIYSGIFSSILSAITAIIVGALLMKRITTNLNPTWLSVWYYQMLSIYNIQTSKMIIDQIKEISERIAPFAEKSSSELTNEELLLIVDSTIKLAQLKSLGDITIARQKEIERLLAALTQE